MWHAYPYLLRGIWQCGFIVSSLQSKYVVFVVANGYTCGIYIGIFPHICMTTGLYIWHLMSLFVTGSHMVIDWETNVII